MLIRCGAIPEPTFIWWDVRLQPRLGTLEVRVMDAQTRIRDTAALAALVQCLVRLEALDGLAEPELRRAPEVIDENRFLAARDGIRRAAARSRAATAACPPRAASPRSSTPAGRTRARSAASASWRCSPTWPATRERPPARDRVRADGLGGLLHVLQAEFSPPRPYLAAAASEAVSSRRPEGWSRRGRERSALRREPGGHGR